MNIHKNARLTPLRREEMALLVIEGAFSKAHAARVYGVSAKIVARWVERYKAEGRAGTVDRSSRPAHMPQATAASIASRIAFSQILPDEKKESAIAFLKAAVAYYGSLGVAIARVMTDNGSCYRSKAFAKACRDLGLKHVRTRPYTPKTNGKAERFIQTALREWAYAIAYPTSDHRAAELPVWLHRYNWHRPHGSLKSKTPISRLALTEDNLLRLHS